MGYHTLSRVDKQIQIVHKRIANNGVRVKIEERHKANLQFSQVWQQSRKDAAKGVAKWIQIQKTEN